MPMTDTLMSSFRRLSACVIALMIIAGCAAPPPPPPAPPPAATADTSERSFDEAVQVATDGLMSQLRARSDPSVKTDTKRGIVIDPMVDALSGQQTVATRLLEQRVGERLQSNPQLEVLPFQVASLTKAQYLVTGTMTRIASEQTGARRVLQIDLAATDLKTGRVVAQASSRARDETLDTNPTPYYRDSPVVVKDKVIDGYIATSKTAPGQPADPVYFERVSTATIISEATTAYDTQNYEDALTLYRNAETTASGEQLRVLNGIYLASWKLGRTAEAEEAFGKVVAFGLSNNNLGVKFLFNPNSTDFWADPQVSGPYGFWLRQIAKQAAATKVCMNVIGHTSRTGTAQYNERLSVRRATYIKQRLDKEAPELARRTHATGVGFRENLVGTGTDDARDALDRRVEFKITDC
jgi:outer membrane protein OmpA-like peptidoglycan-associated protein